MRRSDEESAKKPGMKRQRSFDGHEDATLPIKRKILRIDPSSAASKEAQNSPLDSDSSQQPSSADGINDQKGVTSKNDKEIGKNEIDLSFWDSLSAELENDKEIGKNKIDLSFWYSLSEEHEKDAKTSNEKEEIPPTLHRRPSWRQTSVELEYKESSNWVCIFTKVLPVKEIDKTDVWQPIYDDIFRRMTTKKLKRDVKSTPFDDDIFKIETFQLKEEVSDILASISKRWINNFTVIIIDYIGDLEDWWNLERVKLFLDMDKLSLKIKKEGNKPYSDYGMRYMIDAIHKHAPRFPDTVSGLRKYKRAVPPRFALSLQSSSSASKHFPRKGLVRSGSSIEKMLQRETSEGWEQHDAAVNLDNILSATIKPSKPLHYYQKRTVLWARSLEAEVRSGVKYRIPLKFFQPEEGQTLPVGFDPINKRLFLEQDYKEAVQGQDDYKRPLQFSFQGGVIANEMGLGKTLSCIALILADRDYSILKNNDEKQAECFEVSGTGNPIVDGTYMKMEEKGLDDYFTKFTLRGKELTGQMRLISELRGWTLVDADEPNYKGQYHQFNFPRRGLCYAEFGNERIDSKDVIKKLNGKKCKLIKHKKTLLGRRKRVCWEPDGYEMKTIKVKSFPPTKFPLRKGRTLTDATLVICPSHIAKHWKKEMTAFLHPSLKKSIKVYVVTTMPQLAKLDFSKIRDADMIVVSIQLFLNPSYQKLSLTHLVTTMEHRNRVYDYLGRLQKDPVIEAFYWKRVILDEGHEIFAKAIINQKTPVMDVLMAIKSETCWYVSGTPFPDNDVTPRGALRFLRVKIDGAEVLEEEARQVFTDKELFKYKTREYQLNNRSECVVDYWYELLPYERMLFWTRIGSFLDQMLYSRMYCRYTTLFAKDVYEVPDYDTEIVRLAMHPYERAIYQVEAMRIDHSRDIMRELCAHPGVNFSNVRIMRVTGRGPIEGINLNLDRYLVAQANRLENELKRVVVETLRIGGTDEDKKILRKRYMRYENTVYHRMRLIFELLRDDDDAFKTSYYTLRPSYYTLIFRFLKAKVAMEKRLGIQLSFHEAIQLRKELRRQKSDQGLTWAEAHADAEITGNLKYSIRHHRTHRTGAYWHFHRDEDIFDRIKRGSDDYEDIKGGELPPRYRVKDFELPAVEPHMTAEAVEQRGSKIAYVVSRLKKLLEKGAHVILFSQWQRLFDGLQQVLDDEAIKYAIVQGNVHVRTSAIRRFNTDPDLKVIMLSLDSAASGANLQKASHVILLDPPAGTKEEADAIEAQAIGRAHRQGQDKKLKVIRIVMRDSIEEELLQRKEETIEWMQA